MIELTGKHDGHVAKLERKASGVDGNSVMVEFSPEVIKALNELAGAMDKQKGAGNGAVHHLREMASGKPQSVQSSLLDMLMVGREIGHYEGRTGDKTAHAASTNVIKQLIGNDDMPPVTVMVGAKARSPED